MRALVALVLFGTMLALNAQDKVRTLHFVPWFGDHALRLNTDEKLSDGTTVRITTFRFYAGIPVVNGDGQANLLPYDYQLVDAEDTASWAVSMPRSAPPYFLLGVDSLTNVSGAFGGELDPIKGMYWAWNSGYINLKLDGTSPASPYPSHAFELHLGGYLPPNATAQRVMLPGHGSDEVVVRVDILPLLEAADVRTKCNVMSPGEAAVRLSRLAATMFRTDVER